MTFYIPNRNGYLYWNVFILLIYRSNKRHNIANGWKTNFDHNDLLVCPLFAIPIPTARQGHPSSDHRRLQLGTSAWFKDAGRQPGPTQITGTDPRKPHWQLWCIDITCHKSRNEGKHKIMITQNYTKLQFWKIWKTCLLSFQKIENIILDQKSRLYVFNLILKVHNVVSIFWKAWKTSI